MRQLAGKLIVRAASMRTEGMCGTEGSGTERQAEPRCCVERRAVEHLARFMVMVNSERTEVLRGAEGSGTERGRQAASLRYRWV